MDIESLKPWNWFKHEDDSGARIPVARREAGNGNNELTPLDTDRSFSSLMRLHEDMQRLFDDVWHTYGLLPSRGTVSDKSMFKQEGMLGDFRANLDVSGDKKAYQVAVDVPGLSEEDIEIEVSGDVLTVHGDKEDVKEDKDKHYYRIERSAGSFHRTLSLPDDADSSAIEAKMTKGVLEIHIPRKPGKDKEESDIKRISISS